MKIDPRRDGERGTDIHLDRGEVEQAIFDYLEKCKVTVIGPRSVFFSTNGTARVFIDPDEGTIEVKKVTRAELVEGLKDAISFMEESEFVSMRSKAAQLEHLVEAYKRNAGH